jgi:hypothetical protein
MEAEYCPNDVTELKEQSKKLGRHSLWLVCPVCGFRKRPESDYLMIKEQREFYENKDRINKNEPEIE